MKKKLVVFLGLLVVGFSVFSLDFGKRNSGCPFCKKEVLTAQTFYEGNNVLGILTHKPALNGHVLIIPKRHVERFEDLSLEESSEIGEAIKKIDGAIKNAFGYQDYVLLQKNGTMAGQTVPHVHFHYLPGANFLAVRFLISPWFKPLSKEKLKLLKDVLSESLSRSDAKLSNQP